MNNIVVTQENILLINSNTYTIYPGQEINISEENVWYINTDQAPDFKYLQSEYESNSLTLFVPEDKYTTITHEYKNCKNQLITVEGMTGTHTEILSNALQILLHPTTNYDIYDNFFYVHYKNGYDYKFSIYPLTSDTNVNSSQDILIPQHKYNYAYHQNIYYPIVKTFAVNLNIDDIHYILSNARINTEIDINFIPNDYTFSEFKNIITTTNPVDELWQNTAYYGNNYFPATRLSYDNTTFENLSDSFGILHTYKVTGKFPVLQPPVNRTIKVPTGNYTVQSFCNYLSNNNFPATYNNHFVYINSDARFVFNPLTVLENEFMDKSTEFTSSKVLINTPQYQNISATVNGDLIEGYYTPAELLRKISIDYNNPINVSNSSITFANPITISCEWFECDGTEVTNNVNLSVIQSKLSCNTFTNYLVTLSSYEIIANKIIGLNETIDSANSLLYGYKNDNLMSITSSIINVDINVNNNSDSIQLNGSDVIVYFNLSIVNRDITVNPNVIVDNTMKILVDQHNSETSIQFYKYYDSVENINISSDGNVSVTGILNVYQL